MTNFTPALPSASVVQIALPAGFEPLGQFLPWLPTLGWACLGLIVLAILLMLRAHHRQALMAAMTLARQQQMENQMQERISELVKTNAMLSAQLQSVGQHLTTHQEGFARFVSERLDQVGGQLDVKLTQNTRETGENLGKLNERLAVIDAAQGRLASLSQDMLGLKDILSNKQARGAYGQAQMEAIVRDGLPLNAYAFQYTLPTGMRPDCVIFLPGNAGLLVVDAKFPLEAFSLLAQAKGEEERKAAMARVRSDMARHIKDVSERYIVSGQTQDIALLFVPAESLYAELHSQFDDVVQKAQRARVMIVSPSLLMLAIQLVRTLVRDQQMQEEAVRIQKQVRLLMDDVGRLKGRILNLDKHFHQAEDDMTQVMTSLEKIERHGVKIAAIEFPDKQSEAEIDGATNHQTLLEQPQNELMLKLAQMRG